MEVTPPASPENVSDPSENVPRAGNSDGRVSRQLNRTPKTPKVRKRALQPDNANPRNSKKVRHHGAGNNRVDRNAHEDNLRNPAHTPTGVESLRGRGRGRGRPNPARTSKHIDALCEEAGSFDAGGDENTTGVWCDSVGRRNQQLVSTIRPERSGSNEQQPIDISDGGEESGTMADNAIDGGHDETSGDPLPASGQGDDEYLELLGSQEDDSTGGSDGDYTPAGNEEANVESGTDEQVGSEEDENTDKPDSKKQWYTCKIPIAINGNWYGINWNRCGPILIVEHKNKITGAKHIHVVKQTTPNNWARDWVKLAKKLGLDDATTQFGRAGGIRIIDLPRFSLYLARGDPRYLMVGRGAKGHFGVFLKGIENQKQRSCNDADAMDGLEAVQQRRDHRAEKTVHQGDREATYRRQKNLELYNMMIDKYEAENITDFLYQITKEEMQQLYISGSNYEAEIERLLRYRKVQEVKERNGRNYEQNLKYHAEKQKPQKNLTECRMWLESYLQKNAIETAELLAWTKIIAEKQLQKVNTLLFIGQSGTGKSLLIELLAACLLPDTPAMNPRGENQFFMENIRKNGTMIMHELDINDINAHMMKSILGGETTTINIKHKVGRKLERIPILAARQYNFNQSITKPADYEALESRCKIYRPSIEIRSPGERRLLGGLAHPPEVIRTPTLWDMWQRHERKIKDHIKKITSEAWGN